MLALEVELLTGRYTAARPGNRDRPEWPPHPARLYSALVAAWAYEEPPDQRERAVLSWLAEQGAPSITCSPDDRQHERSPVAHYVPVNDIDVVESRWTRTYRALREAEAQAAAAGPGQATTRSLKRLEQLRAKAGTDSTRLAAEGAATTDKLRILADRREKQSRTFPTTVPEETRIRFTWPAATPGDGDEEVLDALAARVSRLGHSSSSVSVRLVAPGDDDNATYIPDDGGDRVLRVPAAGLLERLEVAHARHLGRDPRTLPAALVPYSRAVPARHTVPESLLGRDWVVLGRTAGPRLPLPRALSVARLLRTELLRHADQPPPRLLAGNPAARPGEVELQLAVVPLPFVGRRHADGELLGVALVFPQAALDADRKAVLLATARWLDAGGELQFGRTGALRLDAEGPEPQRQTLRPATWCRRSRFWASVTPVTLDGVGRALLRGTREERTAAEDRAVEQIRRDCEQLGLPSPISVQIDTDGPLVGVPPRRAFPPARTGAAPGVHVRLVFAEPVAGPLLLGAGRWLGQGLCRPYRPGSAS